jgi:tetratricopeptide (TPR) repeat protein
LPNAPGVGNRPGIGAGPGIGDRPGIDNRPGVGDPGRPGRPGGPGGSNVANRPGIGNGANIGNRPIVGDRPVVGNGNRIINNGSVNIANRPSQLPAGRADWWGANQSGWWRAGAAYHRGWVNGYWHGFDDGRWSNWGTWLGVTAIAGLATWGISGALNTWGYMPYENPYYADAAAQPVAAPTQYYDYSQPIDTLAPPPTEEVTQASISTFDQARAAFLKGDYPGALTLTDQALAQLPSDATIHEFRALCLFALGRYDESAATLYAVLSAGPGWDWTTLSGLYPGVDVYTQQLRALEAQVSQAPSKAPPRFVLAYHYLTMGSSEAALAQYREILKLQPGDKLSAQLAQRLGAPAPAEAEAPPPNPRPSAPEGQLEGTWAAEPTSRASVALVLKADKTFQWTVTDRGKQRMLKGRYEYDKGELILSPDKGEALDGRVTWQAADRFVFQLLGGGADDPGLAFHK